MINYLGKEKPQALTLINQVFSLGKTWRLPLNPLLGRPRLPHQQLQPKPQKKVNPGISKPREGPTYGICFWGLSPTAEVTLTVVLMLYRTEAIRTCTKNKSFKGRWDDYLT